MMTTTTCPILSALRHAASAILASDAGAMAVAYCELDGLLGRPEHAGERGRVERMMRGLARRIPE